jgi:hypothetical protein
MKKSTSKYVLLGLVVAVIVAFAYLMAPGDPLKQKISSDIAKVNARFTPSQSIDLAQAMKITTHDAPHMLNPPGKVPPLLLFPPSAEDLAKLSGQ